ncbi:MAG TPA: DHHA1 domain-containing protein [Anaerolineales bacterium]|nr:DHHA1 domain-containing protein [Anaerolineales bacterium]
MDIIFSHGHCPDGFTAALIACRRYPEAKVVFLDHGMTDDKIADITNYSWNNDVLMTDFSFRTREQNDRLAYVAKSFRILDHHKTAQATLEGAPYAVFDMNRSGAGLTWDYLYGKDRDKSEHITLGRVRWTCGTTFIRPWWVNYIEAQDLWKWGTLPEMEEVCAYLRTLPYDFDVWNNVFDNSSVGDAAKLGQGALALINKYVLEAVGQRQTGLLNGYKVAVVNALYMMCSEVGAALSNLEGVDMGMSWFERPDGFMQFSLRSIKGGPVDVSAIAKSFGGGGHASAAGFQLPYQEGRKILDAALGRGV